MWRCVWIAESVGGEDDPDAGPESARHLALVRGGQEGAGEWNTGRGPHASNPRSRHHLFCCSQFQNARPVDRPPVLIPHITFNSSNGSSRGVGVIGRILFLLSE